MPVMQRFLIRFRGVFAALAILCVIGSSVAGPGAWKAAAIIEPGTHSLSGHVSLGNTDRAAGAGEVTVTATEYPVGSYTPISVTTDANGDYVFPALVRWSFVVSFHDTVSTEFTDLYWRNTLPNTSYGTFDLVDLQTSDAVGISVTLPSPAALTGTVSLGTTDTKAAAGEASVTYQRYTISDSSPESSPILVTANGAFSFPSMPPGMYRLFAKYLGTGGFQDQVFATTFVFMGSTNQAQPSIVLRPTFVIDGHVHIGSVTSPAGAGEVTVSLDQYARDRSTWDTVKTTTTDAAGGYSFQGLSDQMYRLEFTASSGHGLIPFTDYFAGQLSWTTASLLDHDVTLDPAHSLSGHVALGAAGVPAAAGSVEVSYWPIGPMPFPRSVMVDAQGDFTTPETRLGTYALHFSYVGTGNFVNQYWPQDLTQTPTSFVTVGSHDLTGLNITLPAGNGIAGRVTHNGSAVANAMVYADQVNAARAVISERSTLTDDTGAYKFQQLSVGDYEVTFVAPVATYANQGWFDVPAYYHPDLVNLGPSTAVTGIDADLHTAGVVTGTVTGAGLSATDFSTGLITVTPWVFDSDSNAWVDTGDDFPVLSDRTYRVDGLAADTYKLNFNYAGPLSRSILTPEIVVTEGAVITRNAVLPNPYSLAHDFTGDGIPDVLATTPRGALYVYPGNGSGSWKAPSLIGSGWNGMTSLVPVGDFDGDGFPDILGRTSGGALYLYSGDGNKGWLSARLVGSGWNGMSAILSAGDFNGDGNQDVLGRTVAGALYLYAGDGHGGWSSTSLVGNGWQGMTAILSPGDFDGDGHSDVIARAANGNLYLYPGDGHGGWGATKLIGSGWNGMSAILSVGDFDGDGTADVLGRTVAGALYLYRGDGHGGWGAVSQIGSGWAGFATIS
ncbi:hypothetical protein FVP33_13190 [Lacisediminihabitans profunda]|uniref:Uncharacterized protein n=2 Tax=Lacisediminihabitans profunda TaxID=2594790 RepID=A0A5C8UQC3_9MICO|nr:hypothetical protein FVP33_13190 [Lacisediminihabitans profunda]